MWTVERVYIYRGGALLAAETPPGVRHFHLDHLGTPRLVTNSVANQTAYHYYYPYGEEVSAFNQDTERLKFTGHERDLASTTGAGDDLDYMHARHCSPVTGRFLSVDPSGESRKLDKPQSWNRFAYARSNPVTRFDPDGRADKGSGFEDEIETACGNVACPSGDAVGTTLGGLTMAAYGAPLVAAAGQTAISTFAQSFPRAFGLLIEPELNAAAAGFAAAVAGQQSSGGITAVGGRAGLLGKVISTDGSLNVTQTVVRQLSGQRSYIPVQSILIAIGTGKRAPDPQGVKGLFIYVDVGGQGGGWGTRESQRGRLADVDATVADGHDVGCVGVDLPQQQSGVRQRCAAHGSWARRD